jgi:signal transduction histidine kinase
MPLFKQRIIGDKQRIKQFRLMLGAFVICLLIPLTLIIYFGFQQFENEVDFQYQEKSVNVLKQINKKLNLRVKTERKRPVSHYNFYQEVSNPLTGKLSKELSPLANPDNYQENIGLIGYFQINADKTLTSPLLPYQTRKQLAQANTNLKWQEIERRIAIIENIRNILLKSDFVIKKADDLSTPIEATQAPSKELKIELFQVKISENNELIIFRNFWLDQQHHIQGFVVDENLYLHQLFSDFFVQGHYESTVQMRLKVIHSGEGIHQYLKYSINDKGNSRVELLNEPIPELEKKYIYHGYVISPFQQIQLKFTTDSYSLGPASEFVVLFLIILIFVIICGCLGLYWVGIKQIELAEQRMNFVSSISHELKTPLTSILMYSEMLKSGMVQDPKIQLEYHEFIYGESGRLSRLISNILKLSNLNRQQEMVNVEYVNILSLTDTIQSKVSSLIEKNGFKINFSIDNSINNVDMLVDLDAFAQIVINLVDNSVKFFNAAKIDDVHRKAIDIRFCLHKKLNNKLLFSVRDYGPGISNAEHEKIFELFYREGNELTRTTPGTGIGLALVYELVSAQGGKIKVNKQSQGVEFEFLFDCRHSIL